MKKINTETKKRILDPFDESDQKLIIGFAMDAVLIYSGLTCNPKPEKIGGALGLMVHGITAIHQQILDMESSSISKCMNYCLEKPNRAMKNGHTNSYRTRDGVTKWGGGLVHNQYGGGFSYLPELGDECVISYTMVESGWMSWRGVNLSIGSHNTHLPEFQDTIYGGDESFYN